MDKLIIFDFDDTLVSTNPLFDTAKHKFAELMKTVGLYHEQVLDKVNEFDIALVKHYGCFAKECFPLALVKAYEHYCEMHNRKPDDEVKQKAYDIGMWIFQQQPKVLEGAQNTLNNLSQDYRLVLLTKGDEIHQRDKITGSGLAEFFQESIVVPDKNTGIFQEIIKRHDVHANNAWSIGNSIKADINPALQLGMKTIWVEGPTWDFEHEEPLQTTHSVKSLIEIPPIIQREDRYGILGEDTKLG